MIRSNSRRQFIRNTSLGLAASGFFGISGTAFSNDFVLASLPKETRIQQIIDLLIQACGGAKAETVDTVKSSDPAQVCTGVVSTFLASTEVIKKTIALGANLIITHEPTYYNHLDEIDWLENDPVYSYKRKLLEDNKIVVWRFHDYWHRHQPDGILHGFLDAVNWQPYLVEENANICNIPERSLKKVASYLKKRLQLSRTFITGDPNMQVSKIALLPGAWGRGPHIENLRRDDVEVLIVGEVAEWETCEWVRDAVSAGLKKGLIILGHAESEEPGMKYLVDWLQPKLDGIKVTHIPANDPFIKI